MNFIMLNRESENFIEMCAQCELEIVLENLTKNGGTLNYFDLTYESDILILCLNEEKPIAFCSLVILDTAGVYVYQIAVKKEYQKMGIGKRMIEISQGIASNLGVSVSAHVKGYNIASQKMFESAGFIKHDEYSDVNELFYEYNQIIKDDIELGLN